jgi:hypothetical protein
MVLVKRVTFDESVSVANIAYAGDSAIEIGAIFMRFSVRAVLRMKRKCIAENLLRSNQISHSIPSGFQQVIMGCTVALQSNPPWVLWQLDLRNAHNDCSRGLKWQELEAGVYFHFLMHIFICMYGDTCTPQWHFGNGPDQPPTSIHWLGKELRQRETTTNVFFNILVSRFYRAFSKILDGRGILLGLADDCNILAPPEVLNEVVQQIPALAMSKPGLTS